METEGVCVQRGYWNQRLSRELGMQGQQIESREHQGIWSNLPFPQLPRAARSPKAVLYQRRLPAGSAAWVLASIHAASLTLLATPSGAR